MSNLKFKSFLRRPKPEPKNREPREEPLLALLSLPEFQSYRINRDRHIQNLPRQCAPYLALSYIWGDPAPVKLIVCNEKRMLITKSLYRSLWTLSHCLGTKKTTLWKEGDAIYLWADGICINQLDVEEKTSQVQLMGEIYRRAKGVVAHLGAPSIGDPRDALLSLMDWTKQYKDMVPLPEPKEGDDLYCPNWKLSQFSYVVAREFLTSVWFTRSWITQEFVLARDLVFLYGFGFNTAAWPWRVTVTIHLNLADSPAKPPGFSAGRTDKEIKALFKANNQFSQWRSLKLRMDKNPDGFNVNYVLNQANLTDATNPKDRIYSILRLLREADRKAIRVDYRSEYSYRQLLIDVAAHCVRIGNTMEMLNCTEHITENLDLPSWVPEWINEYSNGLAPMLYKASGDTNEEVILEEHDSILRIKGYIVDYFDYFSPGVTYPDGHPTGRWNSFAPETDHSVGAFIERAATIMCQQLFLSHSRYSTKECAREVVRGVITCDQGWSGERSTAVDREQYNSYLSNFRI
ncbi:heterokaryon incompatibility protein [Rutstroemia sp. NJR-2017a WRK4]|nr:heterokaryon incompatibility protein [Rutstroemia sp. NJR-2017a WRK4]